LFGDEVGRAVFLRGLFDEIMMNWNRLELLLICSSLVLIDGENLGKAEWGLFVEHSNVVGWFVV
jgi:hypothetical protein